MNGQIFTTDEKQQQATIGLALWRLEVGAISSRSLFIGSSSLIL